MPETNLAYDLNLQREEEEKELQRQIEDAQPHVLAFIKKTIGKFGIPELVPEDVLQDTMKQALTHMHQFRGDAQLSTWLNTIALNCVRQYVRRKVRRGVHESIDEPHLHLASTETTATDALLRKHLSEVLDRISPISREALSLTFEGNTAKEAADLLGITPVAFSSRLFKARKEAKALLREQGISEEEVEI